MTPLTPFTLDLIRHGEPVGGRMYRGQIDHPLSDHGWAQMRSAVATPAAWQQIVSSPLARCQAFAVEQSERLGLPLQIDPRLAEIGFGSWEGRTGAEIRAADPLALRRFYADPVQARPEGAEPLADFHARVGAFLQEALSAAADSHWLVVTHAGVIRSLVGHTLGLPLGSLYRLGVDNAAFTRLQQRKERPLAVAWLNRPAS